MTDTVEPKSVPRAPAPLPSILFVEDSDNDFVFARHELNKLKLRNPIFQVRTVEGMFDYLQGNGVFANRREFPKPAAIVLDVRLPGFDSLQVQAMLRSNIKYRSIPLIHISSPERVSMLKTAIDLGANGYLLKPFSGTTFQYLCKKLSLPVNWD